ncbi:MAG: RNA 2',3'-cyclic phosphodiesterase, partial [Isosphaeraceae bacterium]|nr:RNA 2',3'-cyclic phosphodiesterase [Isosphaeraceae bacterium]
MPSTTRTFVAIEIPSALSEALARLQTQLGPEVPDARWIGRGNFHVTLAFLGDVNDRDLDRLGRAVGEAVAPFEPFALRLEGLGAFPEPGRPRSFWAGLAGEALDRLKELQRAVSQAVASVGYPPSDDRFSPHVTLARIKT